MVNKPAAKTEAQDDLTDIKRKLAWRMGAAGLMIIGLLGGLALFDHYSAPTVTEPSEPQFTEPVPVPKKMVTQPVTPAEPPAEASKDEGKPAEPEASAPPIDSSARLAEPPPRPEVPAQPALPRASQPATRAPSSAVAPAVANAAKVGESKPAAVATPAIRPATPAESAIQPQPTSATPPGQAALSRLFKGFALQAGVFTDPRRAEELHAKLMLEGIPSSIESRVEVGPFKTRAEAEAARAKMKSLGIDTVLLLPKGSKR
jgi:DedD protein